MTTEAATFTPSRRDMERKFILLNISHLGARVLLQTMRGNPGLFDQAEIDAQTKAAQSAKAANNDCYDEYKRLYPGDEMEAPH